MFACLQEWILTYWKIIIWFILSKLWKDIPTLHWFWSKKTSVHVICSSYHYCHLSVSPSGFRCCRLYISWLPFCSCESVSSFFMALGQRRTCFFVVHMLIKHDVSTATCYLGISFKALDFTNTGRTHDFQRLSLHWQNIHQPQITIENGSQHFTQHKLQSRSCFLAGKPRIHGMFLDP